MTRITAVVSRMGERLELTEVPKIIFFPSLTKLLYDYCVSFTEVVPTSMIVFLH